MPLVKSQTDLGVIIRERRKSSGFRIDDAALMCGVSVSLLSALENGSRPVGLDKVFQVLNRMGIDLHLNPRA